MKGYSESQLGRIDVELKEAVCDSLVNTLVGRVSGMDERGRMLCGRSPCRNIVAGQLLPRYGRSGEDETSDIRISSIGVDFVIAADSEVAVQVTPRFSVYLRVLPLWKDFVAGGGQLDFDFRLRNSVQQEIDSAIKTNRGLALKKAGVDRPDWKSLSESERATVRTRRAEILARVREQAYAEHGIELVQSGTEEYSGLSDPATDESIADPDSEDEVASQPAPVSRLLREGRRIPLDLIDAAHIPGKWKRLDLRPPTLELGSDDSKEELKSKVEAYNRSLGRFVADELENWVCGEGADLVWRDVRVVPGDALSEEAWSATTKRLASVPVDSSRVVPDLSDVVTKVDRQREFINPNRLSFRVALDNQSAVLAPRDALARCNTIFGIGLSLQMPAMAHRPMRLDRVRPSYRFRDYLNYPGIGLNCGIVATRNEDELRLESTIAPRFAQPRMVARQIDVPFQFSVLRNPEFDVSLLRRLPAAYRSWIDQQEKRVTPSVVAGVDTYDAKLESAELRKDLSLQRAESQYIERGIELLTASKAAADQIQNSAESDESVLANRAAPWRAWVMTNEAFASQHREDPDRGWRLFQMAFILAHIPVFASRMAEWRDYHDEFLDEDSASLLYFPTGGGKSEAFYGALLFAMFLDRLRGKDRGITALIRYPLRLLTLQQAQRLLKLVVHAEVVRRRNEAGKWPFEIGFWVGRQNTPNWYGAFRSEVPLFGDPNHPDDEWMDDDAARGQAGERAGRYVEALDAYNKIPECPTCGRRTGLRRDERETPNGKRIAIVCFNLNCDWNQEHGGIHTLPFLLTDDAIYSRVPCIILGTIDKLAMLGQYTGTVSRILGMFGLARWMDSHGNLIYPRREEQLRSGPAQEGCRPVFPAYSNGNVVFVDPFPSLIIQDEAHLLEESLGTFSGLFETLLEKVFGDIAEMAGDKLKVARRWSKNGWTGPRMAKVIAATATIAAPDRQLETLYQRRPLRFPCAGSDIYHSFFAEPEAPPTKNRERELLAQTLPIHRAPEATAPWMRLYMSLMTNDATHTVTTVAVLATFHSILTETWDGLLDEGKRANTVAALRSNTSRDEQGEWRRAAIDRAVNAERFEDVIALVDLHRIALTYVTNKKGGDQIIDALGTAVERNHRRLGRLQMPFDSRLISGGIDMKQIQAIMVDAETSFEDAEYPEISSTVRNIVATSAISHGVDVDRFNSMFFAGLPSDIAEYIQASSRVGRRHVGFVMLLPTPQNRRDRYVVETHDVFHRFLERMIPPPAVERWAENAIKRTLASQVQAWAMLREGQEFLSLADDRKHTVVQMDQVSRVRSMAKYDHVGFCEELTNFVLQSIGFNGRGVAGLGAPAYDDFYRGLIEDQVEKFAKDLAGRATIAQLRDYWNDIPAFRPPMTSLRDVDEAGYIVAAARDPLATGRSTNVDRDDLVAVMKAIRQQRGVGSELDADGGQDG